MSFFSTVSMSSSAKGTPTPKTAMLNRDKRKVAYYTEKILTKVQSDDILNAIFGAFKGRFEHICKMSEKVLLKIYEKYGVPVARFHQL